MRRWFLHLVLVLSTLVQGFIATSGEPAGPESTRSAPPDTTPYARPATPEDYAPFGRPAIGPEGVAKCQESTKGLPAPDLPSGTTSREHKRGHVK